MSNVIHVRPDITSTREAVRAAELNLGDLESIVIYAKRKVGDRIIWASGSFEQRKALLQALIKAHRELKV